MRFIVSIAILVRLVCGAECVSAAAKQSQGRVALPGAREGNISLQGALALEMPTTSNSSGVVPPAATSGFDEELGGDSASQIAIPHVISAAEIEKAVRASFGPAKAQLRLEIAAHSCEILPPGELEFPLSGASKPSNLHPEAAILWRGSWRTEDGRVVPVWARVRALSARDVVRLRTDVPRGTPLTSTVLEQTTIHDSALRVDPPETSTDYEGKILLHFAKAGAILSLKQVTDPPRVLRNTLVPVDVVSGSLHLRLEARATTDGQAGESIRLTIPGGHRQFSATIQADGSAILNVSTQDSRTDSTRRRERNDL